MLFVHAHVHTEELCFSRIDPWIVQANSWVYCALRGYVILGFAVQLEGLRFAQRNPQMFQIHTLRLTNICFVYQFLYNQNSFN